MIKESQDILYLILIIGIAFVVILFTFTVIETEKINKEISHSKYEQTLLFSTLFELRMDYMKKIVETASLRPELVQSPEFVSEITDQQKGIPENTEIKMRQIAKDMLKQDFSFQYFFYVIPNGDMYFLEPFEDQLDLIWLNYSFRDWYTGALKFGKTYLSEIYVSAATGHNVMAISIPIYDKVKSETLNGIWVGAIDLYSVGKKFQEIDFKHEDYFVIVDHRNIVAIDTRHLGQTTELEEFELDLRDVSKLDVVQHTRETMNNVDMFITFVSIPIGERNWIVMQMQPYEITFAPSLDILYESIILSIVFLIILICAGVLILSKTNKIVQLTNDMKEIDIKKSEFATMASHELKTPLVPIKGYLEMVLEEGLLGTLNAKQKDILEKIQYNTGNMEKLILRVLLVQRLDLGEITLNVSEFDVSNLMNTVYTDNQVIMEKKNIKFVNLSEENSMIKTDFEKIKEVFSNLILNAVDFTPDGGKIEIDAKSDDDMIVFSVRDNGTGISPENQVHLFKKFYQVDTSVTRKHGGTGLGLSICKGLTEGLGGKIWVESELNKGSTFYFTVKKTQSKPE